MVIIEEVLDLPAFPIETALGIYTPVVMFNSETIPHFQ
jgi:hypothetical protein